MSWRVARSIVKLRDQIDARFPNRNRRSDGYIGDVAHRSRISDHNAWLVINGENIVTAGDWTDDDSTGFDTDAFTDQLATSRDRRIKYVIANGWIMDSRPAYSPWKWRRYTGPNGHYSHMHLSVLPHRDLVDDSTRWAIPMLGAPKPTPKPAPPTARLPRHAVGSRVLVVKEPRMTGTDVRDLQRVLRAWYPRLGVKVDGWYGPATAVAVRHLQERAGIKVDGEAGRQTFGVLGLV